MALPNDLLIGLDIGTESIEAAAFAPDGRQLAHAAVPRRCHEASAAGSTEQEVGETWRATAAVLRALAQAAPQLAERTAALAITGGRGRHLPDR